MIWHKWGIIGGQGGLGASYFSFKTLISLCPCQLVNGGPLCGCNCDDLLIGNTASLRRPVWLSKKWSTMAFCPLIVNLVVHYFQDVCLLLVIGNPIYSILLTQVHGCYSVSELFDVISLTVKWAGHSQNPIQWQQADILKTSKKLKHKVYNWRTPAQG